MNSFDLITALESVDEKCVKRAKEDKPVITLKRVWVAVSSLVACLLIVALIPVMTGIINGTDGGNNAGSAPPPSSGGAMPDTEDAYDYVNIYYLDGESILYRTQYLRLEPKEIFNAWREANAISSQVKCVSARIEVNGKVTYLNNGVASFEPSDTVVYTLTLSKNFEQYFTRSDYQTLFESLKKTMTEYLGQEVDVFRLVLGN